MGDSYRDYVSRHQGLSNRAHSTRRTEASEARAKAIREQRRRQKAQAPYTQGRLIRGQT